MQIPTFAEIRCEQRQLAEDRHFAKGFDGGEITGRTRLDVIVMQVNRAQTLDQLQALAKTNIVVPESDFLEQLRKEAIHQPPIAQAAVILFSCRNQIKKTDEETLRAMYNLVDVPLAYYIQFLLQSRESLGINWMRTTDGFWPSHLLANLVGQWEQNRLPYDFTPDLGLSSHQTASLYGGRYQRLVYEANWLNQA